MATISLYNISDNPKKLVKNPGNALYTPTTFEPYQPLSDLTGTVLIPYKIKVGNDYVILEGANYAKLNGKYYFITDRVLEPGGKLRLYLKIDVLMTYAEQIKNCPAVNRRSANLYNAFIYDNQMDRFAFPANGLYNFWHEVTGTFSFSYDSFSNLILVTMG